MLHKRNVLMGCSIDDDIWPIGLEDPCHALSVRYGHNLNTKVQLAAIGHLQLLLDVVGAVFIDIQDNELFGIHLGYLSAELGTYGATTSCNEDGLIPVVGGCLFVYHCLLGSEEKLLDLKLLKLRLISTRLHMGHIVVLHLYASLGEGFIEVSHLILGIVVDSEEHFLDVVVLDKDLGSDSFFIQHHYSIDMTSHLGLVSIDEAPDLVRALVIHCYFIKQIVSQVSGAKDSYPYLLHVPVSDHIDATEGLQEEKECPTPEGVVVTALEGIAVGHPYCQGAQKAHGHQSQHLYKG